MTAERQARPPVHPFLLLAYFFVFLYANNVGSIQATTLLLPLALAAAAVAVVYFLLWRGLRDPARAALLTSAIVLLFFTYGHVFGLLFPLLTGGRPGTEADLRGTIHLALSAGFLLLLLGASVAVRRLGRTDALTAVANAMGAILILMAAVPLLGAGARGEGQGRADSREPAPVAAAGGGPVAAAPAGPGGVAPASGPDIYLIVLDGYARADVLERHYAFHNGAMLDSLRSLGFRVADRSRSNYGWTSLSLASLLNMRYLDDLAGAGPDPTKRLTAANVLVRDNEVVRRLRERGYRYIHVNSTYGATHGSPLADEEVACRGIGFQHEAYRALIESTWLRMLDAAVAADLARCHLHQFAQLGELASREGPKFVFAHFIPPHHPYLFDRDGRVLRRATIANQMDLQNDLWADRAAYLEQLRFVNAATLEAVRRILATSARPPIVILVSDHGPHLTGAEEETYMDARFANFAAFHLPGVEDPAEVIPDGASMVNTFRLLLAEYFGDPLDPLPDRHFHSTFGRPYDFRDVTPVVRRVDAAR